MVFEWDLPDLGAFLEHSKSFGMLKNKLDFDLTAIMQRDLCFNVSPTRAWHEEPGRPGCFTQHYDRSLLQMIKAMWGRPLLLAVG